MDDIHKKILRKFHTLCQAAGLTEDEKMAIVANYNVESSADIDTHDLIDICNALALQVEPKAAELDRLRKQVMASIGGYLRATHHKGGSDIIKGIACQATGYENFNRIPAERLRNLYYAFLNKQKDICSVDAIAATMIVDAGHTANTTVN